MQIKITALKDRQDITVAIGRFILAKGAMPADQAKRAEDEIGHLLSDGEVRGLLSGAMTVVSPATRRAVREVAHSLGVKL